MYSSVLNQSLSCTCADRRNWKASPGAGSRFTTSCASFDDTFGFPSLAFDSVFSACCRMAVASGESRSPGAPWSPLSPLGPCWFQAIGCWVGSHAVFSAVISSTAPVRLTQPWITAPPPV